MISTLVITLCLSASLGETYGASSLKPCIVGGTSVEIHQYPWQVVVMMHHSFWCGGSIIGQRWVLTAAHCMVNAASSYMIRAGVKFPDNGATEDVQRFKIHHSYDRTSYDYDVSVLRIKRKFKFETNIQPVRLSDTRLKAGTAVTVTGWGLTSEGGRSPLYLRAVRVRVVDMETCRKCLKRNKITDRMFCAGEREGGKDSCQGDSGGPATVGRTQYGITSWGIGCGRPLTPGVYAHVTPLRKWISDNVEHGLHYG